ncbi:MAG: hypothetical protein KAS15_01090, partial [Nanoarchaeota archaeon]|nr:hypothetical protein [Nanoarchaeota archaeon]
VLNDNFRIGIGCCAGWVDYYQEEEMSEICSSWCISLSKRICFLDFVILINNLCGKLFNVLKSDFSKSNL